MNVAANKLNDSAQIAVAFNRFSDNNLTYSFQGVSTYIYGPRGEPPLPMRGVLALIVLGNKTSTIGETG